MLYQNNYNIYSKNIGIDEIDIDKIFKNEGFEKFFKQSFSKLSKHKRYEIIKFLSLDTRAKYKNPHKKNPKYGNLDRSFSEIEYNKLLFFEESDKAKFIWKLQWLRGIRVGEVSSIKIEHIDWNKKILRIWTLKARQWDEIVIEGEFEIVLRGWINNNIKKIRENEGYIVYSENKIQKRKVVSSNWIRKQFRITRNKAELDDIYDKSRPNGINNNSKPLYRLTTHSLRHSAITNFYLKCRCIVTTKKFARHKDIKTTLVYIHLFIEDVRNVLKEKSFNKYDLNMKEQIRNIVNDIRAEDKGGDLRAGDNHSTTLLEYV